MADGSLNKTYFYLVKLPVISISVFLAFFIISNLLFPGSEIESIGYKSDGYSFSHNFFSDLGAIETTSGENNIPSALLFNSSVIFLGITLILFYLHFKAVFVKLNDNSKASYYARITAPIGVIAGLLYAGVGAIPLDVHLGAHVFCAKSAFLTLFFVSIFHIASIYHSKHINSWYATGHALFVVVLICYLYILFLGPTVRFDSGFSESDLILQVLAQKSIVFSFITSILIQVLGFHRVLKVGGIADKGLLNLS